MRAVVAVIVVLGVIAAVLLALTLQETSSGSVAIDAARDRTSGAVSMATARAADQGESLEVSWSAVPVPGGGSGHMVVALLRLEPSGSAQEAQFVVAGDRVVGQNALGRSMLPE